MKPSRLLVFLVAALAACSDAPAGITPGTIRFIATPSYVIAGGSVHVTITNLSPAPIGVVVCYLGLQRWEGSAWEGLPDGSFACSMVEDSVGMGASYQTNKSIGAGTTPGMYRAEIMISDLGMLTEITSNSFAVVD